MEIVNHVSAFENYQNFSNVIAERPKPGSEKSEPIKKRIENWMIVFRLGRHDDHSEYTKRVSSSILALHSPALFIQRDNSDFETKKRERIFKMSWTD